MTELNQKNDRPENLAESQSGDAGGASAWQNVAQSLWQKPAMDELAFMRSKGAVQSSAEIDTVKAQVEKAAQDPQQALLNAVRDNRVVGIGDIHGPLGPHMALLADEMPHLKASGITHLAVEIPATFQNKVEQWSAADQNFLHDRLKDKNSLLEVIDAAKKVGITVTCVDEFYNANGEKLASRDRTMARGIENILKDPQARVAFFAGAEHMQDGFRTDSFGPSAVDILRRKNVSVKTFLPQIASSEDALMPIARDLNKPVNVSRADVPSIGGMKNAAGTTYDKWDNVVFYPTAYKMDGVKDELKQFGKDPGSELRQAVADKHVVFVGEMTQALSEQARSPHRDLLARSMADLRQAGLTDLAIDMPQAYQGALDEFKSSGQFSTPLPDTFDRADFKNVLEAARQQGIELHAIGLQNEMLTPPAEIIDKLAGAAVDVAHHSPGRKVMVWCREEKIANFKDISGQPVGVSESMKERGVSSANYAAFTQDFTDPSLGLVTGVTPRPLTFDPARTKLLKDVPNTLSVPMQLFDNVIVYPSP